MIMDILKLVDGYVTRDKKNNSLWLFFEHKPLREELDGGFGIQSEQPETPRK